MKVLLNTVPLRLKFRKEIQKADFELLLIMKQELNFEIERRQK